LYQTKELKKTKECTLFSCSVENVVYDSPFLGKVSHAHITFVLSLNLDVSIQIQKWHDWRGFHKIGWWRWEGLDAKIHVIIVEFELKRPRFNGSMRVQHMILSPFSG
jgi:hypothetical protein